MNLLKLAERVEAAEGPDRELDCLIWAVANGHEIEWQGNCLVAVGEGVIGWVDPGENQRNFSCIRAGQGAGGVKAYTASLDAAMQLVPEGWHSSIFTTEGAVLRGSASVRDRDGGPSFTSGAATPALALTAAALRAKAGEG